MRSDAHPIVVVVGNCGETASESLAEHYRAVREASLKICAPLQAEDYLLQSMPDVSPPKWHLAHTTWFFEKFVLREWMGRAAYDPRFDYLFNSYYESIGPRQPRPQRALISRPNTREIREYRRYVDKGILAALHEKEPELSADLASRITLGLHHEQQHQELLLTDIQHILFCNPLQSAYAPRKARAPEAHSGRGWIDYAGGIREIGARDGAFSFDNERPRHRVFLEAFSLSDRLVTNGEFLEFLEDGAYAKPRLWLSDAWDKVQGEKWAHPLYWKFEAGEWSQWTLYGWQKLERTAPVCHVSYYEADAFARWAQCRLPTEAEWEIAAARAPLSGNFVETGLLAPAPAGGLAGQPRQLFGDAWEWTQSSYAPYPRFRAEAGSLGEYNGKFMCNQVVLRGGSCFTPRSHIRATYRNFFPAHARWQCSGLRLAKDIP